MNHQISIRGRQYTLRSDDSDEDLQAIARYVDGKMDDMSRGTLDDYTVALLTAMNIASEYQRFRTGVLEKLDALDREAAGVSAILDAALPELASSTVDAS